MRTTRLLFAMAFAGVMSLSAPAFSQESDIIKNFIEAFDAKDKARMSSIVEENKDAIPAEIRSLLRQAVAPGTTVEDKEGAFYLAEVMANIYKDKFGDVEPLKEVKRARFESLLGPAVRLTSPDGVHIVDLPEATDTVKNIFKPDNIIIKKGETVRWVNYDKVAHVFASMPFIGKGGLFAPSIEPGGSWEYTFDRPGEYYYICFIHKGMIGKVTVEEGDGTADGK